MILTYTDHGHAYMAADPHFGVPHSDPLFFLRAYPPISGSASYYEQLTMQWAGKTYFVDYHFTYPDGEKRFSAIDLYDASYVRLATALELDVPVTAGSLAYGDDRLFLTAAPDWVHDGGGSDLVDLGGGDDRYTYAAGEDLIIGGAGFDVVLATELSRTETMRTDPRWWTFVDGAGDTVFSVSQVERVVFADGVLAFDVEGVTGQVQRLYRAAFDRTADERGLGHWVRAMDAGAIELEAVASAFLLSEEFEARFGPVGEMSEIDFVATLYRNILGREPEPEGHAFWVEEIAGGRSRESVLVGLAESGENRAATGDFGIGVWWYV